MASPQLDVSSKELIQIRDLCKRFDNGHEALKQVSLSIREGEILALLGPNGAGKTTLISIVCGIVNPTSGEVIVDGHSIIEDFRVTRSMIGLVTQEINLEPFTTVWQTVCFSRELFGRQPDPAYIESLLKDLSLWDKKDDMIMALSGGMKRRVLIAKALSHQPRILFLDEPTAGVDVELRQGMWETVDRLRASGVTIILTTHYIEEAEQSADRVAVINDGEILLIEDKDTLMRKLGKKTLMLHLKERLETIPTSLARFSLSLENSGMQLIYQYDSQQERTGITSLLHAIVDAGIGLRDLDTRENSLEEIFVDLVRKGE